MDIVWHDELGAETLAAAVDDFVAHAGAPTFLVAPMKRLTDDVRDLAIGRRIYVLPIPYGEVWMLSNGDTHRVSVPAVPAPVAVVKPALAPAAAKPAASPVKSEKV